MDEIYDNCDKYSNFSTNNCMKISDLIEDLIQAKEKYGDVKICTMETRACLGDKIIGEFYDLEIAHNDEFNLIYFR